MKISLIVLLTLLIMIGTHGLTSAYLERKNDDKMKKIIAALAISSALSSCNKQVDPIDPVTPTVEMNTYVTIDRIEDQDTLYRVMAFDQKFVDIVVKSFRTTKIQLVGRYRYVFTYPDLVIISHDIPIWPGKFVGDTLILKNTKFYKLK